MCWVHVRPPSSDMPVNIPLAPPVDQRSCCQTPTTLFAFRGLSATIGSTSALTYSVPTVGAPSQPAAKGEVPLTRNWGSPAGGCTPALLLPPPPPQPTSSRMQANIAVKPVVWPTELFRGADNGMGDMRMKARVRVRKALPRSRNGSDGGF